MGTITFNGVSTESLGIKVKTFPDYEFPEPEIETVHIPGRNGDLVMPTGSYKNVSRKYTISKGSNEGNNFLTYANAIMNWLNSAKGAYAELEDSYEPLYFRLACYKSANTAKNIFNKATEMNIEFYCKPQRFLKTGKTPITISSSGSTLNNSTNYTALPLYKISGSGSGTFTITGSSGTSVSISISQITNGMYIDTNSQNAYSGTTDLNDKITLTNAYFPLLTAGGNVITWTGGITAIEVTPRWWTL